MNAFNGAPPGGEVQVPIVNLLLQGVPMSVGKNEQGQNVLVVGPMLLNIHLPLDSAGSRAIAGELLGGIEIPTMRIPKGG
jgi:hypothetical protein